MTHSENPAPVPSGRPPITDLASWNSARDELLVREKAHTREGDAIAAARRRLPMVEIDGSVLVTGKVGAVPFLDLFEGRNELVIYQHMWHDGAPHQGQCEGCTSIAWHLPESAYLNARGISYAVVTSGTWNEVEPFVDFMGYTQPWYSVHGVDAPIGGRMGYLAFFLREGDRVFLTYSTTGRGTEIVKGSTALLDMSVYGRGEKWEDKPDGWPQGGWAYWRTDENGDVSWGENSRPVPQWTRPGATPVTTLGRTGHHHE